MNELNITSRGGQHMHANWICVSCNSISKSKNNLKHYNTCDNHEVYAYPSTSEAPKRKARSSKWMKFKKNNVFIKPVGWWWYFKDCWFYKNFNR